MGVFTLPTPLLVLTASSSRKRLVSITLSVVYHGVVRNLTEMETKWCERTSPHELISPYFVASITNQLINWPHGPGYHFLTENYLTDNLLAGAPFFPER